MSHSSNIIIHQHDRIYTLISRQLFFSTRAHLWEFISNPQNLQRITPNDMHFTITSPLQNKTIYNGQIITYRIKLWGKIWHRWVTEIKSVEAGRRFIDEQRIGPYSMWHHEHHLTEHNGGIIMEDRITFQLPMGRIGQWVLGNAIKRELLKIFAHRHRVLEKLIDHPNTKKKQQRAHLN